MVETFQKVVPLRRGPKTGVGKARVSQNAIQHGLLASCSVLATENRDDYEKHVTSTIESLGANSHVEILLATRIAQLFWRLARLSRYETGVVNKGQLVSSQDALERFDSASLEIRPLETAVALLMTEEATDAPVNPSAVELVFDALADIGNPDVEGIAESVLETEPITANLFRSALLKMSSDRPGLLGDVAATLRARLMIARLTANAALEKVCKLQAGSLLPPAEALDSIMRYEAHLQRVLSKTLIELRAHQQHLPPG